MPKIKHIKADLLSDEELTAVSDMFEKAERRMDEKLMEEIDLIDRITRDPDKKELESFRRKIR